MISTGKLAGKLPV